VEQIKSKVNSFYLIGDPRYSLVTISLCKFLYGFYTAAIGSLLVPIGIEFGISIRLQSIVFPFNYLGQIIIIFFAGYFADKFGKKIVHIMLLLLLGVFALFFNYIGIFYLFLIFFFFMGMLGISINTIADAAVSDTFEKRKGFYLNIAHIFFGLGALSSPALFNWVFSLTGDFRSIYFLLFLLSFLVLFLVTTARYPFVDSNKIKPGIITHMLKNPEFLSICIFALLSAGTMHSISGWIPTLFNQYLDVPLRVSNYSLSFFWVSIVIGRFVTAILARRFDEFLLIRILNVAMFFVLAVSSFFNSYFYLLLNYLLFGLLIGGSFPLLIAFSASIYPLYSSTRLAIIFSFTAVGMFLVPTLVGMLAEYFLIYRIIALTSISFLIYIFIFQKSARKTG
jgi:MFS transporter, FHS family, glucose/mannose:H+ symporter